MALEMAGFGAGMNGHHLLKILIIFVRLGRRRFLCDSVRADCCKANSKLSCLGTDVTTDRHIRRASIPPPAPGGGRGPGSARGTRREMKRCSSSTLSCAVRPWAASEMISNAHSAVVWSRKSMPMTSAVCLSRKVQFACQTTVGRERIIMARSALAQ